MDGKTIVAAWFASGEDLKTAVFANLIRRIDDALAESRSEWQEDVLTRLYLVCPVAVAEVCDTQLDQSGELLGRIRERAARAGRTP